MPSSSDPSKPSIVDELAAHAVRDLEDPARNATPRPPPSKEHFALACERVAKSLRDGVRMARAHPPQVEALKREGRERSAWEQGIHELEEDAKAMEQLAGFLRYGWTPL